MGTQKTAKTPSCGRDDLTLSWKKTQKVDFIIFFDPFRGFTLKTEFMIPAFHDCPLEPKIKKCGDLLYLFIVLGMYNFKTFFRLVDFGGPTINLQSRPM